MNLTCAIIDDEPLAISLLESYVLKTPFLRLKGTYAGAVPALAALQEEGPVDLLFLDIQMPELSGLEFSRMLDASTRVIFTTAFDRYAVDSYKVNALDYLLKPISYPDFLQSVTKALHWFELVKKGEEASEAVAEKESGGMSGSDPATQALSDLGGMSGQRSAPGVGGQGAEPERIFIKTDYKLVQLELGKILYIEGLKDYVKIYTEDDPRPLLSLTSMKAMEELLPASRFIRVHRSFIVQPAKIRAIERNRIVLGKTYIPISDNYRQKFFDFLAARSLMPKL